MIQFAIGLALLAFSIFVGSFQYFDNVQSITNFQERLENTKRQVRQASQFEKRIARVRELVMPQGDDQVSKLNKRLELGGTKLTFQLVSKVNPDDPANKYFYRHTFEINGVARYFAFFNLLNQLDSTPGVVLLQACMECGNPPAGTKVADDEHVVRIRGYIYVYNPNNV